MSEELAAEIYALRQNVHKLTKAISRPVILDREPVAYLVIDVGGHKHFTLRESDAKQYQSVIGSSYVPLFTEANQ